MRGMASLNAFSRSIFMYAMFTIIQAIQANVKSGALAVLDYATLFFD